MSQLPDHLARFQKSNSLGVDDILGVDDLLCMAEQVANQEEVGEGSDAGTGAASAESQESPSVSLDRRVRKRKVYIKDAETQKLLVQLCIARWAEYVKGPKKKFWEDIRQEFRELLGLDVVAMGLMRSWEDDRRRENKNKSKSGVALANTDREQALDQWIELIDDMQAQKEDRKKTNAQFEKGKLDSKELRHNMSEVFSQKRKLTEDDPEEGSSRRKSTPAKSNAKIMESLLSATEAGDEKFMTR